MKKNNSYGFFSRFLHLVALGNNIVPEISFDLDALFCSNSEKCIEQQPGSHIFVAGLARSGTTLLMRLIYATGECVSLTYKDMPFVLGLNSWKIISNISKRERTLSERAHGDGLDVDYDSPEALEEVFWRTFCRHQYIYPDHLTPMVYDKEIIEKFRIYISRILICYNGSRYLSKNNNNILRLDSIGKAFPDSTILVPFRDPVDQSVSLLQQHRHFKKIHENDSFARQYMTWLVHHEFGGDHRPFVWGEDADKIYDRLQINYWLLQWREAYDFLLKKSSELSDRKIIFVDYDRLCREPVKYWTNLAKELQISSQISSNFVIKKRLKSSSQDIEPMDNELLTSAREIHYELKSISSKKTEPDLINIAVS